MAGGCLSVESGPRTCREGRFMSKLPVERSRELCVKAGENVHIFFLTSAV